LAGLSKKDTTEKADQIEETEETSMVENATPDEAATELPALVRLSPIRYEILRAARGEERSQDGDGHVS
jgi:hypothetical protein